MVISYVFGFKDLATKLGEVVGTPLMEERPFGTYGDTEQYTTTGRLVWIKSINKCYFFPCATESPVKEGVIFPKAFY